MSSQASQEFANAIADLENRRDTAELPDRPEPPKPSASNAEQFAAWFEGREHVRTDQLTNETLNEGDTK